MASLMKPSLLLILLLFTISLQVQARENRFFSKTSRSDDPLTTSNYNNNNNNDATFMDQSNSIPSTFTSEFNGNKERDVDNNLPSSLPTSGFNRNPAEQNAYNFPSSFDGDQFNENTGRNVDHIPSTSSLAGEFPSKAFNKNQEYYYNTNNDDIPRGGRYENRQYGMSDTRFMENGRYFYDINADRNRGAMNENNNDVRGHGSMYGGNYRTERAGYNQNYQENQDEFYDP